MKTKISPPTNEITRQERTYKAGSIILFQGEIPRSLFIVKSGVVKVYSISQQGDEQIVQFHLSHDVFPLNWVFKKARVATFFYEALTDCSVSMINAASFLDSTQNGESPIGLIDHLASNYSAFLIRINALQQPKARDKLIYTLYYLSQRYGESRSFTKNIHIPIPLTHAHFAAMLGITRETVAIELGKLKNEKVISYRQKQYFVHLERLMELIGEDSFANLKLNGNAEGMV